MSSIKKFHSGSSGVHDDLEQKSREIDEVASGQSSIVASSVIADGSERTSAASHGSHATEVSSNVGSDRTRISQGSTATEKSWMQRASHAAMFTRESRSSVAWPGSSSHHSSKVHLEDMTNKELVNTVQELQKKTKHFELENMVFVHFLQKNDPTALEEMQDTMQAQQVAQERASISSKRLTITRASRIESQVLHSASFMTQGQVSVTSDKEGPRINIQQKTDLILREMDDIQASLTKVNKKCHSMRHKLRADLEEMDIREMELRESMETFENVFVTGTLEKYAQKNPAEKFAQFMEDCFKHNRATIDKLRLRTSSLKVQYRKLCSQLTQKRLLGENLQEVDFEQLEILNRRLVEKIEKRNLLLIELKRMNGRANLLLSRTKTHLLVRMDTFKEIKDTIAFREDLITKLDDECDKVAAEVEKTKAEYDRMKTRSENYKVPAILDYVRTISELGVLKKNLKVWARRKQIQDMALVASMREMKNATGDTKTEPAWLTRPADGESKSQEFQFQFEKEKKHKKRKRRTLN